MVPVGEEFREGVAGTWGQRPLQWFCCQRGLGLEQRARGCCELPSCTIHSPGPQDPSHTVDSEDVARKRAGGHFRQRGQWGPKGMRPSTVGCSFSTSIKSALGQGAGHMECRGRPRRCVTPSAHLRGPSAHPQLLGPLCTHWGLRCEE
jgi:hypothetical protein